MADSFKIVWDKEGDRTYETGVDRGVLYVFDTSAKSENDASPKGYCKGVAWNGLTGITETHEGGEPEDQWADNIKYLTLISTETLGLTITAYTYPEEFEECDGTAQFGIAGVSIGQQTRKRFGLCYRTKFGNDTDGDDHGYKLHLVYGCFASPSDKDYATVNDSPEAIEFSWDVKTTPIAISKVAGAKPTASIVIDSTKITKAKLTALENKLYGTGDTEGVLPTPDEVYTLVSAT